MNSSMPYSHIIKDMKAKTGKSLNDLLYEWNKAKREIEIEELKDPYAYSKITDDLLAKSDEKTTHRDLSQLISERFNKNVLGDETENSDVISDELQDEQQNDIETSFEDDSSLDDEFNFDDMFGDDDTFDDMFGDSEPESEQETTEPTTESEGEGIDTDANVDDFSDFDDIFSGFRERNPLGL